MFIFVLFSYCAIVFNVFADNSIHRHARLVEMAAKDSIINLNGEQFTSFALSKPRNYSLVMMLTALNSERNCEPCKDAYEEFKLVANSWRLSKQRHDGLFFVMVDFDASPDVFEKLNMKTAPSIILVDPISNIKTFDHMPIQHMGFSAETIATWIGSRTSMKIRIFRPPSHTGTVLLAAFMTLAGVALWFKQIDLSFLRTTSLWCNLSLGVIFFGITGQVYNHIQGPPLLHGSRKGEIKAFIYPSSDYQFIAETLIVMALYLGATIGIVLIHKTDALADRGKKKLYLISGVALFTLAYSLVLSVFRRKYHGYPYSLFFG